MRIGDIKDTRRSDDRPAEGDDGLYCPYCEVQQPDTETLRCIACTESLSGMDG